MNKRLILSIIFLTIALDFFNLGLMYPIFTSLIFEENGGIVQLGASEFQKNALFGILMSAFPFGQFFGAPVLGSLSDSYSRRKLLLLSLVGAIATLLLCAWGVMLESLTILLIGRFCGGLMAGNMTLAYASLADFSLPEEKVRNFALIPLASGTGFAAGPYVAGVLADWYAGVLGGFAVPFLVAAVLSLVNLILAAWKFPETATAKEKKPILEGFTSGLTSIVKMFRGNPMRPYFWVLFMTISSNFVFVQFVGPFAIEKFNISVVEVGYLYANIGIAVALGHLFVTRRMNQYFSVDTTLCGSLVCLAVLLLALLFAPNVVALHVVTALIMLGFAVAYTSGMAMISNKAPNEAQGETMGIAVSIQSLSEFLPALILGFLAALFLGLPIFASAIMAIIGSIIFYLANKPTPMFEG